VKGGGGWVGEPLVVFADPVWELGRGLISTEHTWPVQIQYHSRGIRTIQNGLMINYPTATPPEWGSGGGVLILRGFEEIGV